jgi:hypothetical protein
MSIWDRIGAAASVVGEAIADNPIATGLRAPIGFVGDLATAPWNDSVEYDGILGTLGHSFARRTGNVIGSWSKSGWTPRRKAT